MKWTLWWVPALWQPHLAWLRCKIASKTPLGILQLAIRLNRHRPMPMITSLDFGRFKKEKHTMLKTYACKSKGAAHPISNLFQRFHMFEEGLCCWAFDVCCCDFIFVWVCIFTRMRPFIPHIIFCPPRKYPVYAPPRQHTLTIYRARQHIAEVVMIGRCSQADC